MLKRNISKREIAPDSAGLGYLYVGGHSIKISEITRVSDQFIYLKNKTKILISMIEGKEVKEILG